MSERKKVAVYCRVSTDLEEQKSSLATQMEAFQILIKNHPGWELVDIYADEGLTGTNAMKRKEFQRMIADCENGKVDYILTKSISRFARNTLDTLSYVRRLKEMGVYVLFEKEKIDTGNSTSELILTVLAAVAQEESRSISENMKWGNRKRYQEGICKWTNVFGYKREGQKQFIIVEAEAEIIRRIFRLYMEGKSLLEITSELNADKTALRLKPKWYAKTIADILHNEKFVGDLVLQKGYTEDYLSKKKVKNDGSLLPRYYYRDHHKAIVDRKTYDRVQKILAMKDRHQGCVQYPYYGLLKCPLCGMPMCRTMTPGREKEAVWSCASKNGCPSYIIREKYIDQAIRDGLCALSEDELQTVTGTRKVEAARVALEWKKKRIKTIEYYMLDDLINKFNFVKWDKVKIVWKFGMTTTVNIHYEKDTHIPLLKIEQADGKTLINGKTCNQPMMVYSVRYKQQYVSDIQLDENKDIEGKYSRPQVFTAHSMSRKRRKEASES